MIVGIMGIMMAGAVYAPLNPNDSLDRLYSLIRQVNAKLILVNQMSLSQFHQFNVPIVDIYEIVNSNNPLTDIEIEELSQVNVTPDSISHLVFTSGSTGTPKAVQLRHRNFMSYMDAHFIQKNDVILQLASSSFDVHLDEINSALVRGAHLVLLKVGGHLDFDYLTKVIHHNNVTFVAPVPSWMDALSKYLRENHHAQERVKQVHWWFLGGKK
jgi:non-ribosomal peptide synthetase component F